MGLHDEYPSHWVIFPQGLGRWGRAVGSHEESLNYWGISSPRDPLSTARGPHATPWRTPETLRGGLGDSPPPPGASWGSPGRSGGLWAPPQAPLERPQRPWGRPGSSPRAPQELLGDPGGCLGISWEAHGRSRGIPEKPPGVLWEGSRASGRCSGGSEDCRRSVPAYIQNHQKTIDIYLKSEHVGLSGHKDKGQKSSTRPLQPVGHPKKLSGDS